MPLAKLQALRRCLSADTNRPLDGEQYGELNADRIPRHFAKAPVQPERKECFMKKIVFLVLMAVAILSLFPSCVTLFLLAEKDNVIRKTRAVEWTFDSPHSGQQPATVLFWFGLKTYNGIDISKAISAPKNIYGRPLVTIPAGTAEFTFDSGFSRNVGRSVHYYTIEDCHFTYKFEPGRKYFIGQGSELKSKGNLIKYSQYRHYVRIYDAFPELSADGRITKKEWKAFFKDLDSHLIASIPIFDTDD